METTCPADRPAGAARCRRGRNVRRGETPLPGRTAGGMSVASPVTDHHSSGRPVRATEIDDSPLLLAQSYRLRYQVYCVERKFLSPDPTRPDRIEGTTSTRQRRRRRSAGVVAGTARLVHTALGPAAPASLQVFSHEHWSSRDQRLRGVPACRSPRLLSPARRYVL